MFLKRPPGPCLTTTIWRCRNPFSQWEHSFNKSCAPIGWILVTVSCGSSKTGPFGNRDAMTSVKFRNKRTTPGFKTSKDKVSYLGLKGVFASGLTLLTDIKWNSIEFETWTRNYYFLKCNLTIHLYPNFIDNLAKSSSKSWHGWVNVSYKKLWAAITNPCPHVQENGEMSGYETSYSVRCVLTSFIETLLKYC